MGSNFRYFGLALLVACLANAAIAADNGLIEPEQVANFQLSDFKDQVVLVDFWASWCAPCRDSLPWLNAMQQKHGTQGLQVVMVNLDRDAAAAAKMGAAIDVGIRQYLDPEGELAAKYELEGMPNSYLYDRSGKLISRHVGFLKADQAKREKGIVSVLERKPK